jgi:hypothetical protein
MGNSHKNLLLRNHWANCNQTFVEWSLDGPLPKMCPVIPKILFLLSKWFQTRRFLWEFPTISYVKLSSAVAAILVCVLKCRTQFWKRTTQESFRNFFKWPKLLYFKPECAQIMMSFLAYITGFFYELWTFADFDRLCKLEKSFHQNFVLIEQMVSDKKIFMGISHNILC